MKTHQHKSDDASLETEQDEKLCEQAEFTRATAKNLTMLDIIGLAVLTVFQQELFRVQRTDDDSPQERVDK
jgi:hypothetical protein